MKFKVGDRVSVYGNYNDDRRGLWYARGNRATVVATNYSDEIEIRLDTGNPRPDSATITVHPKQCRKLKPKKKPRSLWVSSNSNLSRPFVGATTVRVQDDDIEFREVRKKK